MCAIASLQSGKDAAGILFDIAQAFPSLAWMWTFMALRGMAVSERLVLLVGSTYGDNLVVEVAGSPAAEKCV